jgi:hypothetical protein
MTDYQKQRAVPRLTLPGHPTARARATLEVGLLDLSLKGARIEHLNLLRPNSACHLELPAALGSLVLAAQVRWSRVVGTEASPEGERLLRYQSGLMFLQVTPEHHTLLVQALEQAASGVPLGNGGLSL